MNEEIRAMLKREGCNIVGFADLRVLSKEVRQNFDYGILIALSYTNEAMVENKKGMPQQYYKEFTAINKRLPELSILTANFLTDRNYKALAKISSMVVQDSDYRTVLPHKTVATLAGVGWIGKCATLVTGEVGSALRLTVVLTNAPLECGTPITKSLCAPNCTACADACPGNAPLGVMWEVGVDREEFFNAHACSDAARARAKSLLDNDETVCGLCISSCPFTKKAFGYE